MELFNVVWNALSDMVFTFGGYTVSLLEFLIFSVLLFLFFRLIYAFK